MFEIKQIDKKAEIKVAKLFKTISDPTRIKIIYMLKNQELNVSKIVESLNMEQSAVSHQLRILRDINLVSYEKRGKEVYYKLADEHVYMIINQAYDHVMEEFN
ncbi:MAG: winged helix-turn-helix transcriptional regulator, partial [Methanocorpusculum parvum]|nr:winged helix-turn-helix transcriptional regulator [Methanocorpusculum parvum]